jgi:fermentation-respiration switch protein FrsA (DUF1100 family)
VAQADLRPELPVLLLHGDEDGLVPFSFTSGFASALERGGHDVAVEVVRGADHHEVYSAAASGELVASWVKGLAGE